MSGMGLGCLAEDKAVEAERPYSYCNGMGARAHINASVKFMSHNRSVFRPARPEGHVETSRFSSARLRLKPQR